MSTAPIIESLPQAPVLSASQLCDKTGVARNILPRLVREGLPAYRLDRKTFVFIEDEAVAWLVKHGHIVDPYRAAIRKLVDEAPPLTPDQAAKIRAVLAGAA